MGARLRRAIVVAPLAAVGALAAVLVGLFLGLAILIGDPLLAVAYLVYPLLLLAIIGVPTAYLVAGVLVAIARAAGTPILTVSFRTVAIAAVAGALLASYGLLWLAENLAEWWMPLVAAPTGIVGARTFVRLRAPIADEPAAG